MIQVTLREEEICFCLEVSGHAESAPEGKDLICAAVSAMAQMLETGMKSLPEVDRIEKTKGRFLLKAPKDEKIKLFIHSFYESCRMLERQYPAHIQTQKKK